MTNHYKGYKIELIEKGLYIYATDYHTDPIILNDEELKELGLMRIPKEQENKEKSNGKI